MCLKNGPTNERVCRGVQRSNSNNNSIIQVVNAVNKGYWPLLKSNTFSGSIPVVAPAWADWHLFGVNPFAETISTLSCGNAMVSAWRMGILFETCYTYFLISHRTLFWNTTCTEYTASEGKENKNNFGKRLSINFRHQHKQAHTTCLSHLHARISWESSSGSMYGFADLTLGTLDFDFPQSLYMNEMET